MNRHGSSFVTQSVQSECEDNATMQWVCIFDLYCRITSLDVAITPRQLEKKKTRTIEITIIWCKTHVQLSCNLSIIISIGTWSFLKQPSRLGCISLRGTTLIIKLLMTLNVQVTETNVLECGNNWTLLRLDVKLMPKIYVQYSCV